MPFIKTIPESEATGDLKEMYKSEIQTRGYLPNFARIFCYKPKVMFAWRNLIKSINENMDRRRYELVTLAAARKLKSSYCSLAHGTVLISNYYSTDELNEIIKNQDSILLSATDKSIMKFAEKIVIDATSVNQNDIEELKNLGLNEEEIFEIVIVATARCFFSKTLDALGAEPDKVFLNMEENLKSSLIVGRSVFA